MGDLGDMLVHLGIMLGHLGGMVGDLGAVLSNVGVMLLPSWCQEGLSSKNIENIKILALLGLTDRQRGRPTAGSVFLRFPSKMLLKPLVF